MVKSGSSCGKPKAGDANLLRMLSPTSPFQSWSSIMTAMVLMAAEDSSENLSFLNEQELATTATKSHKKRVLFIIEVKPKFIEDFRINRC